MSETGAPRASASNKLAEVVNHQISLSQAAKTFKTHGPDIIVVLSADATPLWKASATRCDISVHCWQQPSDAGAPNLWPIWWAMWGGDDTHFMLAMDKAHDLNGQVQDLCHNCNYEANPRYCTFANSWSTPCREHSTCLYLCTVLLLRLVHET